MNAVPASQHASPTLGACAFVTIAPGALQPAADQCSCELTPHEFLVTSTSRWQAACGDDLLVYCPSRWLGPRPAKVIDSGVVQGAQLADVNVTFHGVRDATMLATVRRSASGNTFVGVPVYDRLDESARLTLAGSGVGTWAEHRSPA